LQRNQLIRIGRRRMVNVQRRFTDYPLVNDVTRLKCRTCGSKQITVTFLAPHQAVGNLACLFQGATHSVTVLYVLTVGARRVKCQCLCILGLFK
jgi:hypothetical protein